MRNSGVKPPSPVIPNAFAQITNTIVAAIEAGLTDEWRIPWNASRGYRPRPMNVLTYNRYRGINALSLWCAEKANGYTTGLWGTKAQWTRKRAEVRDGAIPAIIVRPLKIANTNVNPLTGAQDEDDAGFIAHHVFNVEQVDGFKTPPPPAAGLMSDESAVVLDNVEAYVAATGAKVMENSDSASYLLDEDLITMPDREHFTASPTCTATEAFYATLLHELVHWTMPENRCDRAFLSKRFGDRHYAMEELVAELGAAFLCGDLGISKAPTPDHAQYIQVWLSVLKSNKRAIFIAASAAAKAADYLASLQPGALGTSSGSPSVGPSAPRSLRAA